MINALVMLTVVSSLAGASLASITSDLSNADLQILPTANGVTLTIRETEGSLFDLLQYAPGTTTLVDAVRTYDTDTQTFYFSMVLNLLRTGTNTWVLDTGTLNFSDTTTTLANPKVSAKVTGLNLLLSGTDFFFNGTLAPVAQGSTILQNTTGAWVYNGVRAIAGKPNGDGVATTITAADWAAYNAGTFGFVKFQVGASSLDSLFRQERSLDGSEIIGNYTPEPAAMSLLTLGAAALLKRRK
jgi:hypothetical protein